MAESSSHTPAGTVQKAAGVGVVPISIAIVCRNNQATIGRALDSVRGLASEIVALDSGSTDRTIEMLEAAGARVQRVEWQGYIQTKRRAAAACTQPWVMILDSDESIEPDLAESLRRAIESEDPSVGGFEVNRKVWYAGRMLHHAWQPEWRLRVVRRSLLEDGRATFGGAEPHEEILVRGLRVARLRGTLRHDTISDMAAFLAGQLRFGVLGAAAQYDRGRRGSAWKVLTSPPGAFLKQIVLRSAWRDGWRGWAAAGATACHALMKHLILLERSKTNDAER